MSKNRCSGDGCERYCFISAEPGKNPLASMFPETWASVYERCRQCGSYFCDRCLLRIAESSGKPRCPKCEGELYTPGAGEAKEILEEVIPGLYDSPGESRSTFGVPDPAGAKSDEEAATPRRSFKDYLKSLFGWDTRPGGARAVDEVELFKAVSDSDIRAVRKALRRGVDVNAEDRQGATALIHAAANGQTEIVQVLIKAGANLSAALFGGNTALIEAAYSGHTETVRILAEAGADINQPGVGGLRALNYAAYRGHTATVRALIQAGTDVR